VEYNMGMDNVYRHYNPGDIYDLEVFIIGAEGTIRKRYVPMEDSVLYKSVTWIQRTSYIASGPYKKVG
jgi:hypothetical protein